MNGLDRLRDVNAPDALVVPQQIELAEIGVHEATHGVQVLDKLHALLVGRAELTIVERGLLELGRRHALDANKGHDEHVTLEHDHVRTGDLVPAHLHQVVHLLLGPHAHYLVWIEVLEAVLEAVVVADVLLARLELVQARLVHLAHAFAWHEQLGALAAGRVQHGGLLAGRDDAADGVQYVGVDHLEEDEARLGVERLLARALVLLVAEAARVTLRLAQRVHLERVVDVVGQADVLVVRVARLELGRKFGQLEGVVARAQQQVVLGDHVLALAVHAVLELDLAQLCVLHQIARTIIIRILHLFTYIYAFSPSSDSLELVRSG